MSLVLQILQKSIQGARRAPTLGAGGGGGGRGRGGGNLGFGVHGLWFRGFGGTGGEGGAVWCFGGISVLGIQFWVFS